MAFGENSRHKLGRLQRSKSIPEAENAFARAAAGKGSRRKLPLLGQVRKSTKGAAGGGPTAETSRRKKALLVQYKHMKKSNRFVDRRFGENNSDLSEDEKSIARLQKQRMKELGGRFSLAEADEELTHLGQSLNEGMDDVVDEREDDYGEPGCTSFDDLHFGGGHGNGSGSNKSKKEVMEEIIAKSKASKALKFQQKEEDTMLHDQLDNDFKQIIESGLMKGMVRRGGLKPANMADSTDEAYDKAQRMLVFESRAQPGERSRTAAETALLDAERLQKLERERIRRMHSRGDDDEDEEEEDTRARNGGFAARRKRRKLGDTSAVSTAHVSGDADVDFDLRSGSATPSGDGNSESEDASGEALPTTLLEARRQAQAAGDHDLQKQFRLASAQLLMKYGMAPTGKTAEEFGDVSSSGGSQERESTSGDEEEEGDGNDDDAGEKDDDDDDGAIQDIGMEDEEQTLGGDLQETQAGKSNSLGGKLNEENATGCGQMPDDVRFQKDKWHDVGPLDIPFTIKAPASYHEFTKLVEGRTPEEAAAVISRIRATNALSLSKDNRRRLQIFYGILVQHFVMLAGQRPLPLRHLDVLATAVQGMTGEVPFYAATLARARLQRMHERLVDTGGERVSEYLSGLNARSLLFLKLLAQVFPASDARHPVLSPASLVIGASLTRIAGMGRTPSMLLHGLFLVQLDLNMTLQSARLASEGVCFFVAMMEEVTKSGGVLSLEWENPISASGCHLSMARDLNRSPDDPWFGTNGFKYAIVDAALCTLGRMIDGCKDLPSCTELLNPLKDTMAQLLENGEAVAASGQGDASRNNLLEKARHICSLIRDATSACVARRRPLTNEQKSRPDSIRLFNPRFEDEFCAERDYDPDRSKAEERRLKKQVSRERRATVRELRKDSAITSSIREAEKQAMANDRHDKATAAMSWLQSFEANMKSGGQGGMYKSKK